MKQNEKTEFLTKDMYHSVILRCFGFNLANIISNPSNFLTFVFEDPQEKAQQVINSYWNRELSVEPRAFVESINEIKTRIYEVKNGRK